MSGQRYMDEFKIEAVKQVTERGHSVADVAQRLERVMAATTTRFSARAFLAQTRPLTALHCQSAVAAVTGPAPPIEMPVCTSTLRSVSRGIKATGRPDEALDITPASARPVAHASICGSPQQITSCSGKTSLHDLTQSGLALLAVTE